MEEAFIEQIKKETDYIAKAKLLQYAIYDKQMRIVDLSKVLNMKPSYLCHLLRLNRLDPIIIDGYYSNLISISHLFMISRLKNTQDMIAVYEKVLSQSLTVLQTEEEVRELLHHISSAGSGIDKKERKKMERILDLNYKNTHVHIVQTRIRAKVSVEIKGNIEETTEFLKDFVSRIESSSERPRSTVVKSGEED